MKAKFTIPNTELKAKFNVPNNKLEATFAINRFYTHSETYIFEQGIASDTWNITHNLGKYPSVTVVDSADDVVIGNVNYTDENNCIVSFSAPFIGKAYLN